MEINPNKLYKCARCKEGLRGDMAVPTEGRENRVSHYFCEQDYRHMKHQIGKLTRGEITIDELLARI